MLSRFLPTSGCRRRLDGLRRIAPLLFLAGCSYGFQGGGGFPSHIRTIFIENLENQTVHLDLTQQVGSRFSEEIPRALGVRPAGREVADARLTGRIVRYDDVAQNYQTGAAGTSPRVLTRQVQITVAVQIVDVRENVILWEGQVTGRGDWSPENQAEDAGREEAIRHLVQQVIDGAQSQW